MRILRGVATALVLAWGVPALAAPAAEIVTLHGKGDYREAGATDWRPARVKQSLEPGQYVRTTEPQSKMGLLLADQTQMTLQGVSIVQVKSPESAGPRKSILEFGKGTGRFQTKTPTKDFRMGTPTGLAAIRGTEWLVEVDDDGRSAFTVVEGEIEISNELGQLSVGADEQGILEKGKPPTKVRLQNARERVQWVSSFTLDPSRYGTGEADRELAQVEVDLYQGRIAAALERLGRAQERFPADARVPALATRAALLADDFPRARATAAAALARFPDSVEVQLAAGEVARLDGDFRAARAGFRRATLIAPKDWRGWHALGRLMSERADPRRARWALDQAEKAAPGNATVLAERGMVEANAYDLPRGRELLDRALAAQPEDFSTWTGLGLARLKSGDPDGAMEVLLKATLIEPRYALAHVYLAVAYWQQGRAENALSELRTASLHDPRDPLPYQLAAMIHSDLMRPGDALAAARESVARLPYVKSLDAVANNLRGGANLGSPMAQLGLEAWALKIAHDTFDPLWAGSHLFLSDRLRARFMNNSEFVQGFLIDPLAFGESNRFQSLIRRPGNYAMVRSSAAQDSATTQVNHTATVNGLVAEGRLAYFLEASGLRTWFDDAPNHQDGSSMSAALGLRPRDDLGFFLYANRFFPEVRVGHGNQPFEPYDLVDGVAQRVEGGASYRPGPDWQVWLRGGHLREDQRQQTRTVSAVGTLQLRRESFFTSFPRKDDLGIRVTRRFASGFECYATVEGAEWKSVDFLERDFLARAVTAPALLESVKQEIRDESRTYAFGARWPVRPWLTLELEVDRTTYEKTNDIIVRRDFANQFVALDDDYERDRWSPRAGFVARPLAGVTLRAAWQKWLRPAGPSTLRPTSIAGVTLDERYVLAGGLFEDARVQAEWEATRNLLVTAFTQRQEIDNLYSPLAGLLNNRPDSSSIERLRVRSFTDLANLGGIVEVAELSKGELRESGFTFNWLATRNLSVVAEGVRASSENTGAYPGRKLAYLPRDRYLVGFGFHSDQRWSLSARGVRRGEHFQDEANLRRVAPEWSGSVQLHWESRDKRLAVELVGDHIGSKAFDDAVAIAVTLRF